MAGTRADANITRVLSAQQIKELAVDKQKRKILEDWMYRQLLKYCAMMNYGVNLVMLLFFAFVNCFPRAMCVIILSLVIFIF